MNRNSIRNLVTVIAVSALFGAACASAPKDTAPKIKNERATMAAANALQEQLPATFSAKQDFLKANKEKIERLIANCTGQAGSNKVDLTCYYTRAISYDLLSQYAEYDLPSVQSGMQSVVESSRPLCARSPIEEAEKKLCDAISTYAQPIGGRIAATQIAAELAKPEPQVSDISQSVALLLQEMAGWTGTNVVNSASDQATTLKQSVTCSASASLNAIELRSGTPEWDAVYVDMISAVANGAKSLNWPYCPASMQECDQGACTADPEGTTCQVRRAGTAALLCD